MPQFDDALEFATLQENLLGRVDLAQRAEPGPSSTVREPLANEARQHVNYVNQVRHERSTAPVPSPAAMHRLPPQAIPPRVQSAPQPVTNERPPATRAPVSSTGSPLDRPKIIFQPVVAGVDRQGHTLLRPDVQLADSRLMSENLPTLRLAQHEQHFSPMPTQSYIAPEEQVESDYSGFVVQDEMPIPNNATYPMEYPGAGQWEGEPCGSPGCGDTCSSCDCDGGSHHRGWRSLLARLHNRECCPQGIGREHVMNALFFIDTTQPLNNCRIRLDAADDWEFPDRAEYFWAKTPGGRGPIDPSGLDRGEPAVDYQDIRFYIERGSKRFSLGTELPIRSVDPELRLNSTGLADMNLTTKTVLLDGRCWQLTQVFRTYLPTGSAHRGMGNGHVSLEPGVAARYKWSEITYIHGDLTYWFPIGADPVQSGQILNAGLGISHVLYDTDDYAVIPTFELDSWTVLDGEQTPPGFNPTPVHVDTVSIVNLHPGVRWVCDKGCDCGTKEFGIAGGISVTEDRFYSGLLRIDFRWTY